MDVKWMLKLGYFILAFNRKNETIYLISDIKNLHEFVEIF